MVLTVKKIVVFFFFFSLLFASGILSSFESDGFQNFLSKQESEDKNKRETLWQSIRTELEKEKYAHLVENSVKINNKNYELKYLLVSSGNEEAQRYFLYSIAYPSYSVSEKLESVLPERNKLLQQLVDDNVQGDQFKQSLINLEADNNPELDAFWSGIKSELNESKYKYLENSKIIFDEKKFDLFPLFLAVKKEYDEKGSELTVKIGKMVLFSGGFPLAFNKIKKSWGTKTSKITIQRLLNARVNFEAFKDALKDLKEESNKKLDTLWSEIKDELRKNKYSDLEWFILPPSYHDGFIPNYFFLDLDTLIAASKNSDYDKKGSELSLETKKNLQRFVNANIDAENFKVALTAMNNQKLDDLWIQLKKILNQPEFDKWQNTSIKIKNKSYDLELLFAAAKEKADVKASVLPLDTKLKLQELVNDQVTSKMVENQLLALNQAETEKNEQAEAEKNEQVKKKQQSQGLTIGLATGGGVLVAAGLSGFLYWFFKIRK